MLDCFIVLVAVRVKELSTETPDYLESSGLPQNLENLE